jgi:ATP-dependent DNA ligase
MPLLNKSKLEIKLGEYAVGGAAALVDPLLVNAAQDYRRLTAARMIPLEAEDIPKRFPAGDYHASLKVDGEFSILVFEHGEILTVNPGGTVRTGLAFHKEAAELLQKAGLKKAIFAGELYFAKEKSKRSRVHDVSRVAREAGSQTEVDALSFAAFDVIQIDGVPNALPFADTWKKLCELFQGGKNVHVVETVMLKDSGGIEQHFRKCVEAGAEGSVVRSDAVGLFKLKPRHTLDAVVIGFTEGTDDRKGMIHDLLIAVMRTDGCLHVLGHVGGGFSNDDRRAFLADLKDDVVKSDYVEVNDQVAYHMVRPESVIEISVLDLISQTTRGQPINKMVLNWNSGENKYEIVRRLPLVGLISPQFVRRRDDKMLNANDIRIAQVTDLVEVALADRDARQLNLPQSTVLRREVATKVLKGATMVRKLVMWQTNKESDGEHYPAFVIHMTDFSPNRKTPLERDIRVSSSRQQIEDLWNELAAEAFTKGWTPVGAALAPAAAPAAKKTKKKTP